MALVLKDRVKEVTTTTGTGSLTLGGAVIGYQSFSSAIGNGNITYYTIYLDGGSEWEIGLGTVSAGTLARTTVLASSNSGSLVNFSSGQKSVWGDYPAGKAIYTDANGNISNLNGSISTISNLGFDTTYSTPLTAGQMGWDGYNTLGLGMFGGNVIQHVGEDTFFYVKASSAITKGQLCMFTGAVGSSGVLTAAPSNSIPFAEAVMGIAAEDIALNAFGLIQITGTLKGVDTSAFANGDVLYYNSTVTGGLTNTYPSNGPIVIVAAVANSGTGGSGVLTVRVSFQTRIVASTGISVTQTNNSATITNSAPDQTVGIASGTGISVTGTYPNFTVTNTAPSSGGTVTSVSGTAPISSTGGTTPAISISQATTSTNGYLSSTDWNTFNNKQPAGSYLTAVTADSPLSGSGTSASHLVISQATTSTNGYLSSTDWNTFNGKATLPSQTGNANKFLQTNGTTTSWASTPTYLPVLQRAGTTSNVTLGNGYLPVLQRAGTTANVTIY